MSFHSLPVWKSERLKEGSSSATRCLSPESAIRCLASTGRPTSIGGTTYETDRSQKLEAGSTFSSPSI